MFEFEIAERQVLDVNGSGVLDACKQRLQLLSARADVSVEPADLEPAAPLRHLALALESNSTAPPSSRTRSDSNVAADDAARIAERRNAQSALRCFPSPTSNASACWPITSSARGDLGNVSRQ
jgi:hypothetical protein